MADSKNPHRGVVYGIRPHKRMTPKEDAEARRLAESIPLNPDLVRDLLAEEQEES